MATIDPEAREQQMQAAEALLLAKYSGGRNWLDPSLAMHAVRAAAYGYGVPEGQEPPEVPGQPVRCRAVGPAQDGYASPPR
ncbi:hypothetical protein ACFY4K_34770 [Streptomyces leeuwenhoekii]|uniref:hypothetical protein n=1 Tax=Streptomyces leeuwenhoekii TaxID=1437453 RepID=UPI003675DA85